MRSNSSILWGLGGVVLGYIVRGAGPKEEKAADGVGAFWEGREKRAGEKMRKLLKLNTEITELTGINPLDAWALGSRATSQSDLNNWNKLLALSQQPGTFNFGKK